MSTIYSVYQNGIRKWYEMNEDETKMRRAYGFKRFGSWRTDRMNLPMEEIDTCIPYSNNESGLPRNLLFDIWRQNISKKYYLKRNNLRSWKNGTARSFLSFHSRIESERQSNRRNRLDYHTEPRGFIFLLFGITHTAPARDGHYSAGSQHRPRTL